MRNLSRNVNDEHLKEIFGACGVVKMAEVTMDPDVNLSTGTATVEFTARDFAVAAVSHLDGSSVDGMKMQVVLAYDEAQAADGNGKGVGKGGYKGFGKGKGDGKGKGKGGPYSAPGWADHRGPADRDRGYHGRGPPPPPPRGRDFDRGPPPRDYGRGPPPPPRDYGRGPPPPPRRDAPRRSRSRSPPPRGRSPIDRGGGQRARGRSRSRSSSYSNSP